MDRIDANTIHYDIITTHKCYDIAKIMISCFIKAYISLKCRKKGGCDKLYKLWQHIVHVTRDRTESSKFRNEIEISRKGMTNHSQNIEH